MIDELTLATILRAREQLSRASTELWNSRLELLESVGDFQQLLQHLRAPIELAGDNCECNNGCNVPCGSNCGSLAVLGSDRARPG